MGNTEFNGSCECGTCLTVVECEGGVTALALALDIAMACDDAAQARYATIYGVAWSPRIGTALRASVLPSTTACTVVGRAVK